MEERQSRSEETRDAQKVYLDLLAELDMTKHFGGKELIEYWAYGTYVGRK